MKAASRRPDLEVGICGEHGGDPESIEFCHLIGNNYVSCSPFRVPVARLAAAQAAMDKSEHLKLYQEMVVIRRLEERSAELYQQGKIGGFLHLYIGQEAVSTGLIAARQPQDRVITAYRDHGVAINVGISANAVMAELLGKATGTSKGKGGSMHLADVSKNFFGGHAIVGAHLPIATGLALGDQYQKKRRVTICMFGDGATNIGFSTKRLNMSKVWNLPVLWVVENNQYGMGTSIERASAVLR
jgi:pyruvate dehydrogenase E1 component alpha subunit